MVWCAAEKKVVQRVTFQLSLHTSQGVGATGRDRATGEGADLAEEHEGGSRVGGKTESFRGMPAKMETQ